MSNLNFASQRPPAHRAPRRGGQAGFSLMEAMVVAAIVAIMAVLAVPSFQGLRERARLKGAAEAVYAQLQFARSESIKENRDIFVHITPGASGTWCVGLSNSAATCDCSSNAVGSCTFGPTGNTMQRNLQSGDFPGVTLGDLTDGAPIFGFESRRGARIFTASTEEEAIVLTGANGLSAQVVHNARGRIRLCGNFGGYHAC